MKYYEVKRDDGYYINICPIIEIIYKQGYSYMPMHASTSDLEFSWKFKTIKPLDEQTLEMIRNTGVSICEKEK